VLFSWFGILVAADRAGTPADPDRVMAWILAVLDALVLWPLALRGARRYVWRRMEHRDEPAEPWGRRVLPPVPPAPVTVPDALGRVAVVVIGALAIAAACGPQEVTRVLVGGLLAASVGPASAWALLRLAAFVLQALLLFPVLWASERGLRNVQAGTAAHRLLLVRRNWYLGAAVGWVASLGVGFVLSWALLVTL